MAKITTLYDFDPNDSYPDFINQIIMGGIEFYALIHGKGLFFCPTGESFDQAPTGSYLITETDLLIEQLEGLLSLFNNADAIPVRGNPFQVTLKHFICPQGCEGNHDHCSGGDTPRPDQFVLRYVGSELGIEVHRKQG